MPHLPALQKQNRRSKLVTKRGKSTKTTSRQSSDSDTDSASGSDDTDTNVIDDTGTNVIDDTVTSVSNDTGAAYWNVHARTQTFECICGEHVDLRQCRADPNIVQCEKCTLWQHASCVNYPLDDAYRGRFLCPHCHVTNEPIASGATLIITPQSISHQWVDEIMKHIWSDSLSVFVYRGVQRQGYVQPQVLANQSLVITTYETLRKEINYVDLPHTSSTDGRKLRKPKRYMAVPSPIVAVQWWRICLDEAQMVEQTTTKTAEMALRLCAINRWCVTG